MTKAGGAGIKAKCIAALLIAGLSAGPSGADDGRDEARALARAMQGDYTTAAQAAADPAYEVALLRIVPIWPERVDGPWLYLEQALGKAPDQPYRQRVYQMRAAPDRGGTEARIFTFPDAPRHVGAWKAEKPLETVDPATLMPVAGCEIVFRRQADRVDSFFGRTEGRACGNGWRGASYMTAEVTVTPTTILMWDRGFDPSGKRLWGPEVGGYRFVEVPKAR